MMRHPEHHHHYQRNRHPPPRIMMPVPGNPHPGVLVSLPSAPPISISTVNQMQPQQQPQQKNTPQNSLQSQPQPPMYYDTMSPGVASDTLNHHPPQPQPQHHHHNHHHIQSEAAQAEQVSPQSATNTTTSSNLPNLANTKEKTPMCLVNELARYNKIQHQYKLTGEQGPAHKKIFTVMLKLGNEEYEAEGASIKKAQHAAAAMALDKTQLRRPPLKTTRQLKNGLVRPGGLGAGGAASAGGGGGTGGLVTPTVELNALAMKRGERTIYIVENGLPPPPPHHHHQQPHHQQQQQQGYVMPYYNRHMFPQNQRFGYDARRNNMRPPYHHHQFDRYHGQFNRHQPPPLSNNAAGGGDVCSVRLKVGEREYPGTGVTIQAARHDAAARAIEEIKKLNDEQEKTGGGSTVAENGVEENELPPEINTDIKSPISLVHEIALKRQLNVTFEVKSENGPPHMKVFVTQCKIADVVVEGEGHGKKISKKRAAEKMLHKLAQLPPLPPVLSNAQMKRKRVTSKKKSRNLVKLNADKQVDYVEEINPISRLIQIQQANKEKEPVYTVIEERGAARRREFVIQASVNGVSANGIGPNKKLAKRAAAQALLNQLGYATPPRPPQPAATTPGKAPVAEEAAARPNHQSSTNTSPNEKPRKVTFLEEKPSHDDGTPPTGNCTGGRQLVPGLLIVNDQSATHNQSKTESAETLSKPKVTPQKITPPPAGGVRSKDKLMYLVQLMNIQAQFSDFPKANHEMYLTLVSLSTNPPQVCHGEGPTIEASHEKAALEALNVLSEMGLDNVVPSAKDAKTTNNNISDP